MSPTTQPTPGPMFLNCQSEIVRPIHFAVIAWDGTGDTLYAFKDSSAFDRQCATAADRGAAVQSMQATEAADWIARGGHAVLHELSVAGVAAFSNLKLAAR